VITRRTFLLLVLLLLGLDFGIGHFLGRAERFPAEMRQGMDKQPGRRRRLHHTIVVPAQREI
jgi:hypothetical protein